MGQRDEVNDKSARSYAKVMDPNRSLTLTFVATFAVFAFNLLAGDGLGPRLQLGFVGAVEIFAGINCACMREFARLVKRSI